MMVSNAHLDLMHGRLPTFDDFFVEENIVETLDFDFIVNGINSIPLHKRLGIRQELLSDYELENVETDASNFLKCFKEKLSLKGNATDFNSCKVLLDPHETESEFTEKRNEGNLKPKEETTPALNEKVEEDNDETFLKYLYDPKGNNLLIPALQKNVDFTCFPKSEVSEAPNHGYSNLADFEKFLFDITTGKYDHLARSRNAPTSSSSSSESEEEITLRTRNLSSRLKFLPSDNNKFSFLKKITDDSLKLNNGETVEREKTNFQPINLLTSDESENETADRRSHAENKRRPKRLHKNDTESKQKNKPSGSANSTTSKTNVQPRRKPNKSNGNSSKNLASNSQSTSTLVLSNDKCESQMVNLKDETNKNQMTVKQCEKEKKSLHNISSSPDEISLSKPTEPRNLPGTKSQVKEIVTGQEYESKTFIPATSQQSNEGASSSKNVESKDQKQINNEKTSSSSSVTTCRSPKDAPVKSNESSDSSEEDWVSIAQKKMSGFNKLLQNTSK